MARRDSKSVAIRLQQQKYDAIANVATQTGNTITAVIISLLDRACINMPGYPNEDTLDSVISTMMAGNAKKVE